MSSPRRKKDWFQREREVGAGSEGFTDKAACELNLKKKELKKLYNTVEVRQVVLESTA